MRPRLVFTCGLLFWSVSGCRYGYELLSMNEDEGALSGDGDDGMGGAIDSVGGLGTDPGGTGAGSSMGGTSSGGETSAGGAASGGVATGGAASGGSGGLGWTPEVGATNGNYHVDSGADPSEAGKTTLRDAMEAAIAFGSHQTITIEPGLSITMGALLPTIATPMTIEGNGAVVDFSALGGNGACLDVTVGPFVLAGTAIRGCPGSPIRLDGGTGHSVSDNWFDGSGAPLSVEFGAGSTTIGPDNLFSGGITYALRLDASSTVVTDNRFVETGGSSSSAILIAGGATANRIEGNLFLRSQAGILAGNGSSNIDIWNNTFVSSTTSALNLSQGSNFDVLNNIITHSGTAGIVGDSAIDSLDYNLFFSNGAHCTGCAGGLGANSKIQDPLYIDFANDNFELAEGSAAIDAGDSTQPSDRNGANPGNYNGTSFDIGAYETDY